MPAEVRTLSEGALRWVQASANAFGDLTAWKTGSAPPTGLFGYVQSMNYTSGRTVAVIMDRGVPKHSKGTDKQPIKISLECLYTGAYPTALSASGATLPYLHLEHRASAAEFGSGEYTQFIGVSLDSIDWTEGAEGNTIKYTLQALAMNGPTASGYLA